METSVGAKLVEAEEVLVCEVLVAAGGRVRGAQTELD